MNCTIYLYIVQCSFKCKYNRICAKITEIIQFIFCSSFMHMYFYYYKNNGRAAQK